MRAQALGQGGACLSLATSVQLSVVFSQLQNLDTPNNMIFDAQSLHPHATLPTLRWYPHELQRTARGGVCWLDLASRRTTTDYHTT